MTLYIKLQDVLFNGQKIAEIGIYREDFEAAKSRIFTDPKKSGYNAELIGKLLDNEFVSKAEHDILVAKVTKP